MRYISSNTSQLAIEVSFAVSLMNLTLTTTKGITSPTVFTEGLFNIPTAGEFLQNFCMSKGCDWGCDRKTRKSNCLQMSLQKKHFFLSYLKTLSAVSCGPPRIWTGAAFRSADRGALI